MTSPRPGEAGPTRYNRPPVAPPRSQPFTLPCAGVVAFALLALAPGCGSIPMPRPAAGSPISVTELVGSTWQVTEIEGKPVQGREPPQLVFDSRTFLSGIGGCNPFHAPIKGEDEGVSFGPIASTKRACEPELMDQEQRFFAALTRKARLESDLDLLFLIGEDNQVSLRLERVFPPDDDTGP